MNSLTLLARLALVLIFATAGAAKLTDLQASRDTVEAFGFSRRLARLGGAALPIVELAVAIALLPSASTGWAAVAALALLLTFSAGVAYALSQGRTPQCNCFGVVSSKQIGTGTLVRNGVFALVAVFVIWKAPGSSLIAWTSNAAAANLAAALLGVAAMLLAVAGLHYRQLARTLRVGGVAVTAEAPGLVVGSEAPDFELNNLDGELVSRDQLLADGKPLLLVFASPTCGPCHALMPELGRWHAAMNESIHFVVIESGTSSAETLKHTLSTAGDVTILMEEQRVTADAYAANATPVAVAINTAGKIASRPMPGQSHIESLVRTMLSSRQASAGPALPAAQQS